MLDGRNDVAGGKLRFPHGGGQAGEYRCGAGEADCLGLQQGQVCCTRLHI